ncbi:MAG: MFS transporter [Elusimicrobium sp.]|jgi:MFS family permease|nr:MFS transporter [Elusimicrobium sp.]
MKLTKEIFILSFANALVTGGYAISVPFFAIYLNVERGLPASAVGIAAATAMLGTSVASGLAGELSDAFGRKRVMSFSLALRGINALMMAYAIYIHAHYMWTIMFYFIGSFFGAFFRPSSNAWIADNIARKNRLEAFGYIRIGLNIGWALGPVLGGLMAGKSFALAFAITGLFFLLTALFLHINIKDTFSRTVARKARFAEMVLELKNKRLALICLFIFMIALVSAQMVTGLSLHGIKYIKLTERQVGLLFSVNGALVVLLQYHLGKIMTYMRITTALVIGCLAYAAGYLLVGAAEGFALAAFGVAWFSIGEMAVSPGSNTLISNIAPERERGRYLGLQELCRNAGTAAGMIAAGVMIQHLSPVHKILPWTIICCVALTAGYGFYRLRPMLSYEEDGVNQPPILPEGEEEPR